MSTPAPVRPGRSPGGRRLPRWATVVLVLLVIVVLAALAVLGLFAWGLSGGWDGLRRGADGGDPRVVAARARATSELDDVVVGPLTAIGPGQQLARLRYDHCEPGQNNWKVHDGYTLRCELTELVVLRPAGDDVTAVAAGIDAAVMEAGWSASGGTHEMTEPAQPDHSYLEQSRSGHYQRDSQRHQLELVVTTRPDSPFAGRVPTGPGVTVTGDPGGVEAALGEPGLKVVVRTSVRYFDDG